MAKQTDGSTPITAEPQAEIAQREAHAAELATIRMGLVAGVETAKAHHAELLAQATASAIARETSIGTFVWGAVDDAQTALESTKLALASHDVSTFAAWDELTIALCEAAATFFTSRGLAPLDFVLDRDGARAAIIEKTRRTKTAYHLSLVRADGTEIIRLHRGKQGEEMSAYRPAYAQLLKTALATKGASAQISTFEVLTGKANDDVAGDIKEGVRIALGLPTGTRVLRVLVTA